ncbi:hypothetical protein Tco_0821576 [Tanacetum coccineum]|uniref:Reverse transcriptase domain-containing protein n=1 Tax=Tanacetum coccineum TaxID=301880 RepID=A0ABQ5AF89_9ASTR
MEKLGTDVHKGVVTRYGIPFHNHVTIDPRIQAARDRQKSYADLKRKPMEFQVGDKVMLKVSPWKGVLRFGKRGSLNPRYVDLSRKVFPTTVAVPLEDSNIDDKPICRRAREIMNGRSNEINEDRIPFVKVRPEF